jgi:DNA-binding PadR family transcriptional regulator
MSAKYALLGLLLHRPAYPYELAGGLKRCLGPAWALNSGQVYQTMERLEAADLVEPVDAVVGGHPDRHVFAITEDGETEFERWFTARTRGVQLSRRPLLVKITFAGAERLQDAIEKVNAYEHECVARLEAISRAYEGIRVEGPLVRADEVLLRLNLSADICQLEGELKWAKHASEMLRWLLEQRVVWPSRRERGDRSYARGNSRVRRELFERMANPEAERKGRGAT